MSARLRHWFRPCLEALEDRCVPSVTFTVTNLKDDGSAGCLRSRITAANAHPGTDSLVFAPGLEGTIRLTGGQITINDNLSVIGPGAARIAVDGNANDRIFNIDNHNNMADLNVTIQGLELRNGKAAFGGAILSNENLTLSQDVIDNNRASSGATGGVYSAFGDLTIKKSIVSGNTASTDAGGVYFYGVESALTTFTLTVKSSTISGNTAVNGKGGGLFANAGSANITKSVISGNNADRGGGLYAYDKAKSLTISGSEIRANRTTGMFTTGGGIFSNALQTTISKAKIVDNSATGSGGGIRANGDLILKASIISNNHSGGNSGGAGLYGDDSTISDCTFSGNSSAGKGGAMYLPI